MRSGVHRIEAFSPEDLDRVQRIAAASLSEPVLGETLMRFHELERDLFLVARDPVDDGIDGFIVAVPSAPFEARVLMIAVAPGAQGKGVGRTLLAGLQRRLVIHDVRSLGLEVRTDNPGALGFYLRHGFEVEGLFEGMYPDGADGLAMRKVLV